MLIYSVGESPDIGLDKQFLEREIENIFLFFSLNICFGCSKEPSG